MRNKINYKKITFYSIFIFLIILGRVIFLDADIPSNIPLTQIHTIDEGFYAISSFNLYNHGHFQYSALGDYGFADSGISDLFQTLLTYISLLIFGNNYYGVRMPSVFISLITIWLFYLTLKNTQNNNIKNQKYLILFLMLYLITDFQYLIISRVLVTTTYRIFFMVLIIYLFSKFNNHMNSKIILIISLLASFSVFFVSIYNIFIYSGTVFSIFIISLIKNWNTNKKQIVKDSFIIMAGTLVMFLGFLIYLKLIYNKTLIDYILGLINLDDRAKLIFKLKNKYILLGIILKILKPFYQNFTITNFRVNLGFLFLFLFLIPIQTYKTIKFRKEFDILISSLLGFLFLQTIFENTYPTKRLIIILPLALIIIYRNFKLFNEFNFKTIKIKKILYIYSSLLIVFLTIFFIQFDILSKVTGSINTPTTQFYNGNLTISFLIVLITSFLFIILLFFYQNKDNDKQFFLLLIFFIIPNIFIVIEKVYSAPEFHYRNSMIKLSKKINNNIIPGQMSFALRFYNKSIPILNVYGYTNKKKEYAGKMSKILRSGNNQIIQFAYKKNQYFTVLSGKSMNLEIEEVYYVGRGRIMALYNVHFLK